MLMIEAFRRVHRDKSGTVDTSFRGVTPLRQRITEDVRTRKRGEKMQPAYIRAARELTTVLGR
jgi:hypothetical protein